MEDYEKKYKEALAIVKSYYERTQFSSVHDSREEIKTLERAFPELKKSSNKQIKEDIKYILANTDLTNVKSSFFEMTEWVNNQDDKSELLDGEDYGIDGLYHAINILEKTLGEVEGYQSDDGVLEHEIAIDSVKELYSKMPKWSDEDEDNLEEIIMFCDTLVGGEMYKLTNEQLKSISKTLKAIKKGTVTPTKKEWSDEDEKLYKSALWHIKNSCSNGGKISGEFDEYNWLKSIKDRVQLQPIQEWSEENYIEKIALKYQQLTKCSNAERRACIQELLSMQKSSEWSEEDEKTLSRIIEDFETRSVSTIFEKTIINETITWLKSIKDKVRPQPKIEWSEEDSQRIKRICDFIIKNRKGDTDAIYQQEKDVHWLKCIDLQKKGWKPSEKQMIAFGLAVEPMLKGFGWEETPLGSLYNDLKKLTE